MAFVVKKTEAFTFQIGENGTIYSIPVFRELDGKDVSKVAKMDTKTPIEKQEELAKEFILRFAPEAEKEIIALGLGGMTYVQIFDAYLTFQADAGKS